jgi:hypothetical protein
MATDFSRLQWTPGFADGQGITDTDMCVFVCMFVHMCVHSFRRSYSRFGAYPNCMHIKLFVKNSLWEKKEKEKKAMARMGTDVGASVFDAGLLAGG